MDKSLQAQGESVRRQVLGDSYVDQALGRADDFSRPFQAVLNEYCWGMVWTDDSLDLKQRSLLNLGMLAALGRMDEFGTHFCGALRNGLSGAPAGVEAFRVARKARESMAPSDSTTG